MTAVPNSDQLGQLQESQTRNPVSEALIQGMQGVRNFFLSFNHVEIRFNMNGPYKSFGGKIGVDGVFRFPYNATIVAIEIVNAGVGTSGQTEIDFKKASNPQGVWSTIFTTTGKITSSALAFAFANLNTNSAGTVKPVMITTPFNVNAGDYFRMDVPTTMDGNPTNLSVSIIYKLRL